MSSEERLHLGIENEKWAKEHGIHVPLAPIVLQLYYTSYQAIEQVRGLNLFERHRPTWLTTPVSSLEGCDETHDLVAVVHSRGSGSNLGFALPRRRSADQEPYIFFWNVIPNRPEIVKIERIVLEDGWRRLVGQEDESHGEIVDFHTERLDDEALGDEHSVWRIGHPYVNPLVMQEYCLLAAFSEMGELKEWLEEHVSTRNLISGLELRGKRRGLGGSFPFEQLLGRFEPILVGEGRIFNRGLKRSQGFQDARPFVF